MDLDAWSALQSHLLNLEAGLMSAFHRWVLNRQGMNIPLTYPCCDLGSMVHPYFIVA